MDFKGEMSKADADLYMQEIEKKYTAKKVREVELFLKRIKVSDAEVAKELINQEPIIQETKINKLSLRSVDLLKKEPETKKESKTPLVLGGIRGKFINEDIITNKSKQRKNPPKFQVVVGQDEDGKVLTKDYASQKSRVWGEFRKVEYERYKKQYKDNGKNPYWSDFQRLCSAVWKELSDDEKQDLVLNGSDIDWINL